MALVIGKTYMYVPSNAMIGEDGPGYLNRDKDTEYANQTVRVDYICTRNSWAHCYLESYGFCYIHFDCLKPIRKIVKNLPNIVQQKEN
jgi:hypothetical protein